MPVFDSLQRASFDGIEFPVRSVSVTGQYRHFTHEYLRVPGGVNEKLERGLYKIEMEIPFHATIKGYGELWPTLLAVTRGKFEQGITSALTIPTIGTIPAFITDWNQMAEMGKFRSGETVKVSFLEDQTQVHLTAALVKVSQSSLQNSSDKFSSALDDLEAPENDQSLFDGIQQLSNDILAIKDQSDLYGGLLVAKIEQLKSIIGEADKAAESLKDPINHELLNALHELWDATINLGKNLAEQPRGPRFYVVPRTMNISEIAAATQALGGTDDAATILLNNPIADAFAISASTRIIYFTS
jgi:prophage DNA circulation protein